MKKRMKIAGYVSCCPVCHCEIDVEPYFLDRPDIDKVEIGCVECKAELRVHRGKGKKGVRIELVEVVRSGDKGGDIERVVRMNPNGEVDPGMKAVSNTLVYRPKGM